MGLCKEAGFTLFLTGHASFADLQPVQYFIFPLLFMFGLVGSQPSVTGEKEFQRFVAESAIREKSGTAQELATLSPVDDVIGWSASGLNKALSWFKPQEWNLVYLFLKTHSVPMILSLLCTRTGYATWTDGTGFGPGQNMTGLLPGQMGQGLGQGLDQDRWDRVWQDRMGLLPGQMGEQGYYQNR